MEQATGEETDLPEPSHPFLARRDDAGHDVAVTTEELGGAVEHEGGAVAERLLEEYLSTYGKGKYAGEMLALSGEKGK
jgi:hypothetical protein